ncbi:unnamed protein product [Arctogadus glacialis]
MEHFLESEEKKGMNTEYQNIDGASWPAARRSHDTQEKPQSATLTAAAGELWPQIALMSEECERERKRE